MSTPIRDLSGFTAQGYDIGRNKLVQILWLTVSGTVVTRWWCPAGLRVAILRAFGANIGEDVLIRHRVRIHWPWKLTVGDSSWIGEGSWLLNLEHITIGRSVCVSQDAFLCTGSHDRESPTFEYDNAPIAIEDGVWIAARVVVLRGVRIGRGATIGAGSVIGRSIEPGTITRTAELRTL